MKNKLFQVKGVWLKKNQTTQPNKSVTNGQKTKGIYVF